MIIPIGRNCYTLCHQYINLTMKEKNPGKLVHIKHIIGYEISKYDNICAILTYLNLPRNNFSTHAT